MGTLLAYIPIGPIGGCGSNADCPGPSWWEQHPVLIVAASVILAAALAFVLAKTFKNLKPRRRLITTAALAVLGLFAAYLLVIQIKPCDFDPSYKQCPPEDNISCESPYVCRPLAVSLSPLLVPVVLTGVYWALTRRNAAPPRKTRKTGAAS